MKAPAAPKPARFALAALAAFSMILMSCGHSYEYKAIPVRPMSAYPGQASLGDVRFGAQAFYDESAATELFGFNVKGAGVLPVQVLIHNQGSDSIAILEGSTIQDEDGNVWQVLPSSVVYDRLDKYTSGSLSAQDGAKRTLLWGLAGAVIGAAVGIAGGTDVGEAAGKGAAVGAAAGASSSILGIGTGDQADSSGAVHRDFSGRSLDHATVNGGQDASGFLYFPAEAKRPRFLNLKVSEAGKTQTLRLDL
jgi:hypothetical protein